MRYKVQRYQSESSRFGFGNSADSWIVGLGILGGNFQPNFPKPKNAGIRRYSKPMFDTHTPVDKSACLLAIGLWCYCFHQHHLLLVTEDWQEKEKKSSNREYYILSADESGKLIFPIACCCI